MDSLDTLFDQSWAKHLIALVIAAVFVYVLTQILKKAIPRYIKETDKRYKTRKIVNYFGFAIIVICGMLIYSSKLTGISVFLGVISAGIAFALQEIIVSIAGFIALNTSSFYNVGDRISIGGIKGDVVDIGILRTSLMEVGDWVNGDLYNGKIVRVSNSFIFKEPVYNYSGEFPFLWDEVIIPIRFESDQAFARDVFNSILNDIQGDFAIAAQARWNVLTESLMIEKAQVEPMVTMSFDENWMTFTLRYVVDFKQRRTTKDRIFSSVIEAAEQSKGKIQIASSSLEVALVK